jgi:hypothetical protein
MNLNIKEVEHKKRILNIKLEDKSEFFKNRTLWSEKENIFTTLYFNCSFSIRVKRKNFEISKIICHDPFIGEAEEVTEPSLIEEIQSYILKNKVKILVS